MSALTPRDRTLIAEMKQAVENTLSAVVVDRVRHLASMARLMLQARVADPSIIAELQRFVAQVEAKLQSQQVLDSDLETYLNEYARIIDADRLNEDQYRVRTRQLTRGSSDALYARDHETNLRHFQVLSYLISPKIRALSPSAQRSEESLIMAYNNFAYAGLGEPEKKIYDFLVLLDHY